MNHFVRFRTAPRLVVLVGIVTLFLLMTLPGYPAIVQDKEAPEGLTGGNPVKATADILEGKWSAFHVHTGKSGGWKHSGTFTITKYEDGLRVTFEGNGGGDNPKAENEVKFNGSVTMDRSIEPPFEDPETHSKENLQTWKGTLYSDGRGYKIEGHVSGAGMDWNLRHGNATTFFARKL